MIFNGIKYIFIDFSSLRIYSTRNLSIRTYDIINQQEVESLQNLTKPIWKDGERETRKKKI